MKSLKEVFAERLIGLREDWKITQQELADELGITRQSLSLFEKGERTINIELLVKIAKYFEVTVDYLLGQTNAATTETTTREVCDYTGLSEKAVNILRAYNVYSKYTDLVSGIAINIERNKSTDEEIARATVAAVESLYRQSDGSIEIAPEEVIKEIANLRVCKCTSVTATRIINFIFENSTFDQLIAIFSVFASEVGNVSECDQRSFDFYLWKSSKAATALFEELLNDIKTNNREYINSSFPDAKDGDSNG